MKDIKQVGLRLPEALRIRLAKEADASEQSLNSVMVHRLRWSFELEERVYELKMLVELLLLFNVHRS
jgi:predicted HicB family RNase H-like nuclease